LTIKIVPILIGIKLAMAQQKKNHEPKVDPHDYDSVDNRPLCQEWATGPTGLLHARGLGTYGLQAEFMCFTLDV
jgi:hypothetical protein